MNIWTHIDDMTWPMPCEDMNDLSYRLTYGGESLRDRLAAASVMRAYCQMIRDPRDKRQRVVRGIRAAMSAEGEVMRHVIAVNPLRGGGYTISSHPPGCGLTFWDGDCWHGDAPGSTERVWPTRPEADAEIPRALAAMAALRPVEWTMPDELTKGAE